MKDHTVLIIDALGGVTLMAMIGLVGWFAFFKPDTATTRCHELRQQLAGDQAELDRLLASLQSQQDRHAELAAKAERTGRLPSRSPIEQDLKTIAALARANHVKVTEVVPSSTVRYPNVLEQRYRVKAEAQFSDYIRFLRAFEGCSSWADITFLKVASSEQPGAAGAAGAPAARSSDMTVSFFSAFQ